MKVGVVSKFPEQEDGIAIYSASLCSKLEEAGVEVVKIGDMQSSSVKHKIDFNSFFLKRKIARIANEEKLDVLHFQYAASHFSRFSLNLNLILALGQKIPVIVTLHEVHSDSTSFREKVLEFLQSIIVKKSSAVIVHTKQQKELLQVKYRKKNVFCILHGLSLNMVHKKFGKNILFFGMLNYGKGVEYLIRAMGQLPGFNLTIAGKAIKLEYERLVKAAADENKLGNVKLDIRWIPEPEKKRLMEQADIMVFPYIWAPYQSGTLHNAFSYGIPVIVSDAGAIQEVVKEFNCGVVVAQRSPKEIAEGIKKVMSSYEIYQQGVIKYREEANWDKSARNHAEAYNMILQEFYEIHGIIEEEKFQKEKEAAQLSDDADISE
jgi:glycosyltransferase involved in cell wall biosynthesis